MKKYLWIAGLALTMALANGCIVIDSEKIESTVSKRTAEPKDVTIHEIDVIGTLSSETHRRDAYKGMAQRRCLCPEAQVHLIGAAFDNLSMEKATADVLLAVVRNRCFSSSAKAAILDRLDSLGAETYKRRVLDAMSKHKTCC